jgi:cellulose synthase operon protein C
MIHEYQQMNHPSIRHEENDCIARIPGDIRQLTITVWLILLAVVFLAGSAAAAARSDSVPVEWLFENSFEKEYLTVNEAVTVVPGELDEALKLYHKGAYRRAADVLYQVRTLNLPDGMLDFISFVLAECYRQLDLQSKAFGEYRFVASRFPDTDKRAPSLFRMLEYAAREEMVDLVDSIRAVFSEGYRLHPLYSSVLYRSAMLYFRRERFGEAIEMLGAIPPASHRHLQATFLSALCHVQLQEWEPALALLQYVEDHVRDRDMHAEAVIVMGDIHYRNNRYERALACYRKVPKKSVRYEYALVKIARCLFDNGKFDKAASLGRDFIRKRADSDYFFEMASILEQALSGSGRTEEAGDIGSRIHTQIIGSRITFEIFDEIDRLTDLIKQWQVREYLAIARQDTVMQRRAISGKERSIALQQRLRKFFSEVTRGKPDRARFAGAPHLAERRYLILLKKKQQKTEDSLSLVRQRMENIDTLSTDTTITAAADSLQHRYLALQEQSRDIEHEHALVIEECLGGEVEGKRESEEMQAKFIDWEFIKYIEKKKQLMDIAAELAERKKRETAADSTGGEGKMDSTDTAGVSVADRERLERTISDERTRLIDHMETMADIYPKSRYTPATLFRLAELQLDRAAEKFERAMTAYEQQLVSGSDSTGTGDFPEYDLHEAIDTYRRITTSFPHDRYADDALFYGALALKKQGLEDSAQAVMVRLIDEYPQSEYYIEANMNIGRYHFEHPRKSGGNGYKLAEEAFRNVLFYRDHPQFIQALYHLGWCYYMQDRYDEAIAAFKYLIEEVELDFDPLRKDEKEVKNPLLRSEAVDYLAISFDQEGDTARAAEFLKLIGNDDYSAMIFNRMGELREEDLDFKTAITRYRKLIADYPLSYSAPEASARLITLFDNANMHTAAAAERERFFDAYSAGSPWHKRIEKRDSVLLQKTDSMVIAIGLSIADTYYRTAEAQGGDPLLLQKAAERYRMVVDRYREQTRAADAAWNLAAILEKTGDNPGAYAGFIDLSGWPGIDSTRREQAALNAIAIAQSLLPADTLAQKGKVDFAGKKLIEAVDNYTRQFPEGSDYAKVLFTMAGVYFNRQLYDKAAGIYRRIIDTPAFADQAEEAMLLLAQCRFGQERWSEAADLFEKVWKKSTDETRRSTANTFLLQSCYFDAKGMLAAKKYDKAAAAFKALDDRFPGSIYGDVALFSAAGAYEKSEKWTKACERYFDLVERYPQSQYAPDALFNASGNYEKAEKFARAAETYELLVSRYPDSPKAKDALFNLGFCYEKLGKIEAMVAANERYSMLYPEEKDVEALLIRSADYYAKTGSLEKAINLYRNFVRRFPQSPKTVEAYYMIGKCFTDRSDIANAQANYQLAEQHNARLIAEGGGAGNLYFASEAALALGWILNDRFSSVKLELPEEKLSASIKEKSGLLSEAVSAYQRVVQYQSEKMFEAGCRMGEIYEDLAGALAGQERLKDDPIKAALKENEIMTAASQLEQTSFVPYRKVSELAAQFDSLSPDQREWVELARDNLGNAILQAGTYLYQGVGAIQDAPVPAEIRQQPLLYYQYRIKLLETLEPLKMRVLSYFTGMLDTLPKLGLDDSLLIVCELNVARLNYLIGSAADRMAVEILKETENLPKSLSEDEREELLFQLEDIVFELQDKALVQLEAARERVLQRRLHTNPWYTKIIETLARLSPEKYGASFYKPVVCVSDESWFMRPDSVPDWTEATTDLSTWSAAIRLKQAPVTNRILPGGVPLISGNDTWQRMYLWKNLFCPGKPRDAKMKVCIAGSYRLYVNGVLTFSDTTGGGGKSICDSATGIVTLFKGGDNILSCEVIGLAPITAGIAIQATLLVDTTEKFKTGLVLSKLAQAGSDSMRQADSTAAAGSAAAVSGMVKKGEKNPPEKMSHREVQAAIEQYRQREKEALAALRHERMAIQRLRILKEESNRTRKQRPPKTQPPDTSGTPKKLPEPLQ